MIRLPTENKKDSISLDVEDFFSICSEYSAILILSSDLQIIYCNDFGKNLLSFREIPANLFEAFNRAGLEVPIDDNIFNEFKVKSVSFYNFNWLIIPSFLQNHNKCIILCGTKHKDKRNESIANNLGQVVDCTPGSLYWKDCNGVYLGCNMFMVKTAGLNSLDDIIGKTDYDLWPESADQIRKNEWQVMQTGKTMFLEETIELPGYKDPMYFTGVKMPLTDQKGNIIGVICNSLDITERKQQEQKLKKAQTQIVEMERLSAYSKIATQVAHDIRSPLTALNALLEEADELPDKQRLMMRNAAQRINDIANNLLAEYKQPEGQQTQGKSRGQIEPCLIYPIIDQVVSEKRQVLENNQSLEFEVADRQTMMCYAKVNRAELARVISNLVNNALEATDSAQGLIRITLAVNNDQLIIAITDNGPGMSNEQLQHVLNPDKTTQSTKTQGHGIGIAHAQETLKRFGAEFDIHSTPGEGTTAELTLKAVKPPLWIARELTVYPQDTIIILDDDPSMHNAWQQFLANYQSQLADVDIQYFTEAQACIDAIRQLDRPYQTLLLADYELMKQSMNGLDVVQATQLPRSVLVTSHYNNNDIIKHAILLGTYVLPKELSASVQMAVQDIPLELPNVAPADLVLLEDDRGFAASIKFLYKKKGRGSQLTIYHTPYELFYYLPCYSQDTPICLDYQFECPVTGLDIAQSLYQAGYTQLYLATGFHMNPNDMPEYIQLIEDKMDITYL